MSAAEICSNRVAFMISRSWTLPAVCVASANSVEVEHESGQDKCSLPAIVKPTVQKRKACFGIMTTTVLTPPHTRLPLTKKRGRVSSNGQYKPWHQLCSPAVVFYPLQSTRLLRATGQ